jgi:DmsE family decaheme c-type cytochrome
MIRFGRDSKTPVAVQNGTCLACHGKSMSASWHAGPHDANKVSCASCHDSHVVKDPVLSARTQADVCYTCHVAQRGEFQKPYAHPAQQGKIACSDCHQPHGSTSEAQLVKATVNQTCYQCHADKRGPFLWEHAPVPEDCSNCHAPHGSSNPGMLTARGPLLCQSCHSQQGHPSLSYGPSGLPGGTGPTTSTLVLGNCMNCHSQVHGSNHPSGASLTR